MKTYSIAIDGQSITCNLCGMRSYNRNNIEQRYCGNCHRFHGEAQDAALEQLYAKTRANIKRLRPSLWRRYCNWFNGLSAKRQVVIIASLSAVAFYCVIDFIRKML